jgi:hypothetical protein
MSPGFGFRSWIAICNAATVTSWLGLELIDHPTMRLENRSITIAT